jgi:hypothetical protein
MKNKVQILAMHGGSTFKTRKDYLKFLMNAKVSLEKKVRWIDNLEIQLEKEFEVIRPTMPLKENANYLEWKIYFERYIPLLKDNIILIGSSLGGIFLVKYLSENKFPKKILSIYLIAPPFDNTILGEDLVGGFELRKDLSLIEKNCKRITLIFSKDDPVVPISHSEKYKKNMKFAKIVVYKSKMGHFKVKRFPELIKMIKGDKKLLSP